MVQEINLDQSISAPIFAGQKIGEIKYLLNGSTLSTINIVAKNDVPKISGWNMISHVLGNWFRLCR